MGPFAIRPGARYPGGAGRYPRRVEPGAPFALVLASGVRHAGGQIGLDQPDQRRAALLVDVTRQRHERGATVVASALTDKEQLLEATATERGDVGEEGPVEC